MFTWVRGCYFASTVLLVPKPFRASGPHSGQLLRDKECPFSGITNSGRVWRKVPEHHFPAPTASVLPTDVQLLTGDPSPQVSVCSVEEVGNFIQKHMPSAYLVGESQWELQYIMPFEEAKKGNMRKLFQALDTSMQELHINSYGVMDTNLEEIFLKITEAACQEEESELLFVFLSFVFLFRGRT